MVREDVNDPFSSKLYYIIPQNNGDLRLICHPIFFNYIK